MSLVSGAESDDNEAVPRVRRRREGVRIGPQVSRPRTDAFPSAQARRRGRETGGRPG